MFLPVFALSALAIGAFLYLLVCVDPNSPGLLGKLNRIVFGVIPTILKKVLGDRIFGCFTSVHNYFFYSNHPIVQGFYILVAMGGFLMYAYYGFYLLFGTNPRVSHLDTAIGSILAFVCFHAFYQACHYTPGIVNKDNNQGYVDLYAKFYDGAIYIKQNTCKTCDVIKPARSKHCRICNMCVSRFDHHCVWLRQCIGQKNYKYFIKFIGLHAALCDFGAYIGIRCFQGIIDQERLFKATFREPSTGMRIEAGWGIVLRYLFYQHTMYVFMVLLCFIMGLSLTGFLIYHLSMIRNDTTTNERMKKSDFQYFFKDEQVRLQEQLRTSTDREAQREIESKLTKVNNVLNKIQNAKPIGLWAGLKQVFSEPDECEYKQKPLMYVSLQPKQKGLCCNVCLKQDGVIQSIPLQNFIGEKRKELMENNEMLMKVVNEVEQRIASLQQQIKQLFGHQTTMLQQQYAQSDQSNVIQQLSAIESGQLSVKLAQELVVQLLEQQKSIQVIKKKEQFNRVVGCIEQSTMLQSCQSLCYKIDQIFVSYETNQLQQTLNNLRQPLTNQTIFSKPERSLTPQQGQQQQTQQQQQQQKSTANQSYVSKQNPSQQQQLQLQISALTGQGETTQQQPIQSKVQQPQQPQQPQQQQHSQPPKLNFFNQNEQDGSKRSVTPNTMRTNNQTDYQSKPQQQQQSNIFTDRSVVSNYITNDQQKQKGYQFQSGNMFQDRSKSPQTNQAKTTASSTLVSRSNIFPKIQKIFAIKAHDKRISNVQVGQYCVFTSSYDKLIKTWERDTGKQISTLEAHTKEILVMKFRHETLASGGVDKVIRVWKHHPRWQLIANLKGHTANVTCIDFLSPKQLISGSDDQSIRIWEIDKQMEIHCQKFEFRINCMEQHEGKLFVGGEGALIIYQCPALQQLRFIQLHEAPIISIVISKVYVITICQEGIIKLLDGTNYSLVKEFKDDYEISSAIYISNYNFLTLGLSTQNGEGKICFWSLDTLRKVKEIYDNGSGVGGLVWEQPMLWSGHDNKRIEAIHFG